MSDSNRKTATEINLHRKSRLLVIRFSDGKQFQLPCEYLRVFSRAKEVRTQERPVVGKEGVNIVEIEPQGEYALRLVFDDGHDTGIYSWDTLYDLGINREKNWQAYLDRLAKLGYEKQAATEGKRSIRLLYFTYLVKHLRKESEQVELPASVGTVAQLVDWLRRRKRDQAHLFDEGSFQVTVNKQFSEPFTKLNEGDEVAFIPTSPNAPVAK